MRSNSTKKRILKQILSPDFQKRFWDKVDIAGKDECWNWTASRSGGKNGHLGYGQMNLWDKFGQHHLQSNQIVLMTSTKNIIPSGFQALHTCIGNRGCCNPEHIYKGTPKNNSQDMVRQGRSGWGIKLTGESHWKSKFTEKTIREIRALYSRGGITQKKIARQFGSSRRYIGRIINRRAWSHVL